MMEMDNSKMEEFIKEIEEILFDLIREGGGDGDTIRDYAERIADLVEFD